MTRRSPKPLIQRIRSLYSWHRWLGVISAFFVIWLAVTGIALEHSRELKLDSFFSHSEWLRNHYGINPQAPSTALLLDGNWLSHVDGHTFLNKLSIADTPPPVGFTRLGVLWAVASSESLLLLNDEAEVLETVRGLDLPGRIIALSQNNGDLLLKTEHGIFTSNPLAANWPQWKSSTLAVTPDYRQAELPPELAAELVKEVEQSSLTWERLMVDAHSGRLFGKYGVWLMDAMAVTFIILGVSGLMLWLRYWRAMRRRKRRH